MEYLIMFASATASSTPLMGVQPTATPVDEPYLLEIVNVSKGFPGVVALSDVQLRVRPGSVLALMGENGAGKSTLMKIIAGIYQPDAGELRLRGKPVVFETPLAALQAGITTVLLPARNRKDLDEIPAEAQQRLTFVWLDTVDDAMRSAFVAPQQPRQS